ncbi:MAG: hypothetical protein J7K54_03850 [Candidatus Aenigmarchaeota archaeon]|nr:hypothetical protein [Candidatus Aenigmarchaeota archaeon]
MTETIQEIKCNCTICGSRFRIRVDRLGNAGPEPKYCPFCRSLLEEIEEIEYKK